MRIIVPYGSGTGIDIVARLVSRPLGERLRQPVIVESKPGGSAIIGVNALKQAASDGYPIGSPKPTFLSFCVALSRRESAGLNRPQIHWPHYAANGITWPHCAANQMALYMAAN